jgi:AraC-like DNA-binding protein
MDYGILIELLIAGNGFAFLAFGVGQLLIKGKRPVNYWSFAFFTYAAFVFLFTAAIHSKPPSNPYAFVWADFPLVSMAGPLFFFYFSRLADSGYRFVWKDQWLFAPPILSILAAPIVRLWGEDRFFAAAASSSGVAYLWVVFCCVFFIRRTLRSAKAGRSGEGRRLRFLLPLLCCVIVWALAIYFFARSDFGSGILILVATLFILALYFYHIRHPELLTPGVEPVTRKGRSKVAGLDLGATVDRLTRIMDERRPYLKDTLTLPELAALASLTPHQLSEILNREMRATFKAYINRYRVKEALRLLRESPESSVLDVALRCGFRSKSAFNKTFLEEAGTTPTRYRQTSGKADRRG